MTKGADAIIAGLLSETSKNSTEFLETQKHVDTFAQSGLRTLFLAYKELKQDKYDEWNKKAIAASMEIKDREEKVAEVDA